MSEGKIIVVNCEGQIICQRGLISERIPIHSVAKPVQVLPVYLLGLDRFYQLETEELAVMSSSHLAQQQHIRALNSILNKTGLHEQDMILHESVPVGRLAYQNWKANHGVPRKLYHPCSGNHLALMLAQRALTGSIRQYERPESAVQKMVLQLLKLLSEYTEISIATDNCGVPLYLMPLSAVATVYRNLADCSEKYARILRDAMRKNYEVLRQEPVMLEGDGCLSTVLTGCGNLLAKTGAGGLLAVGIPSQSLGLGIQSSNGWFNVARLAQTVFRQMGLYSSSMRNGFENILKYERCQL